MQRYLTLLTILLVVVFADSIAAQITVTGDARLRPRLDLRDQTTTDVDAVTNTKTTDGYYYYRARLNFKSDLGEGWFGHVQLGSAGFGYWTGKFGDPSASFQSKPSSSSVEGANRGGVDYMLIYFGRKTKEFGYMGGLIPVNGLKNPMLDLHYYSSKMIDVPFFLYSNNGAHGFTGYISMNNGSKINATVFVDNNMKKVETDTDSTSATATDFVTESDHKDQYSIMFDAPIKVSDFTVQPVLLFTAIAEDSMPKPMTYGANIFAPKTGNFSFSGSIGMSSQSEVGTAEYSAWYTRLKAVGKLGKGTLTAWVDLAEKKFDADDQKNKFTYLWLSYTIPVFKSDHGSVSIKPTWRHIAEKREDGAGVELYDFSREKIELTVDFKFK